MRMPREKDPDREGAPAFGYSPEYSASFWRR